MRSSDVAHLTTMVVGAVILRTVATEEERQKAKDDVLLDLGKVVRSLVPKERDKTKLQAILTIANSPFVLAIVSGLFISIAVAAWQDRAATHQRAEARRIELEERKQKVFVDFADSFAQSASLAESFKSREAWLRSVSQQPLNKRGKYPDGRDYSETVQQAETLRTQFLKGRMPDSICNQILTCFHSSLVLKRAASLRTKCDELLESFDFTRIGQLSAEINSNYKQLIEEMAEELRRTEP
jgi:hypothetical protein